MRTLLMRQRLAVPSLIYTQGTSAEVLAVKLGNGILSVFHVDKTEATRPVAFAVGYDFRRAHRAQTSKIFFQLVFGGIERKVTHKDFFYQKLLLTVLDKRLLRGPARPASVAKTIKARPCTAGRQTCRYETVMPDVVTRSAGDRRTRPCCCRRGRALHVRAPR